MYQIVKNKLIFHRDEYEIESMSKNYIVIRGSKTSTKD